MGNWHGYSPRTLRTLQMICIRAQKPLAMTIGPIAQVKVTALIQVSKFKALKCLRIKVAVFADLQGPVLVHVHYDEDLNAQKA